MLYDDNVLTDREQQIVELLRRDPLMKAEALAETLGTSRASINVHLSNLGKKGVILGRGYVLAERPGAVVIGGANVDLKARSTARATGETSNPGHGSMAPGGVARNVAENIARLGDRVHLISVVGRDPMGDNLLEHTAAAGVRLEYVARTDRPTGTYTAILDVDGELIVAVADMGATAELGAAQLDRARDIIAAAGVVVVDGNLSLDALNFALDLAAGVRTVFEPVSVPKAAGLVDAIDARVYAVTPNRDELAALTGLPTRTDRQVRTAARVLHQRGVELVWVRLGERGSMLSTAGRVVEIPAVPTIVEDVTGAGDSMLGAFCHVLLEGGSPDEAARFGHAAAALTIASPHTVRPDLTPRLVRAALDQETTP
jgi:pseudouridine kinase